MSEQAPQTPPDASQIHPHLEQFPDAIQDPAKAEVMAYAENPHREDLAVHKEMARIAGQAVVEKTSVREMVKRETSIGENGQWIVPENESPAEKAKRVTKQEAIKAWNSKYPQGSIGDAQYKGERTVLAPLNPAKSLYNTAMDAAEDDLYKAERAAKLAGKHDDKLAKLK